MKRLVVIATLTAPLVLVSPASAQFGSLGKALGKAQQLHDELTFTEAEEIQLGRDISAKLRDKYGVVQDPAIHKYVTLVGTVLAQASSRPKLPWTFIVLDTDGINAFAAPGGFIHITRGALALIQNEAELADVLGHEISHVTEKHTLNAITKSKAISLGAEATRSDILSQAADRGYSILLENKYDRGDELDADKVGVALANRVGYAPTGLAAFLTRLNQRNAGLKEPSGLFASHPETEARVEALGKVIASGHLTSTATVAARYHASVNYPLVAVAGVPQSSATSAAASSGASSGLGLSSLSAVGRERSSNQTISSAGSRGVNPDRDAKGGPNKALVPVTVTAAEVAAFRKGIVG
ncbi:MAG TPA: M48 family metalloprotease [Vicinamibacterales bacterium]|jgi:predicted Zn-dependent protease|nr:M48 family metalloprotease [Vicinamibacterales bacterium]